MEVLTLGENEDVIQINDEKLVQHALKNVIYEMLEYHWSVVQPEQYDQTQWLYLAQKVLFHSSSFLDPLLGL